jgi:hypothetical protein
MGARSMQKPDDVQAKAKPGLRARAFSQSEVKTLCCPRLAAGQTSRLPSVRISPRVAIAAHVDALQLRPIRGPHPDPA